MLDSNALREKYRIYAKENSFAKEPAKLYEPVDYIMNLGGKNIRAMLTLCGYQMFDDNIDSALSVAHAIELFHNFSLVHDDIMDEATLRRGKPCVHQKFGINTGILSGDIMLIYVFKILATIEDHQQRADVIDVFTKAAIDVCEGQQYDVDFEVRKDVSIEEYIKMISLKTAVLIAASLKMGALLAGASKEDANLLYDFGWHAGVAFQIQDDLLDAYGETIKVGKRKGGDIIQNKKTILFLEALNRVDKKDRNRLELLFSKDHDLDEEQKIEAVLSIFDQNDIKGIVANVRNEYKEKAFKKLEKVNTSTDHKKELKAIVEYIVSREQ